MVSISNQRGQRDWPISNWFPYLLLVIAAIGIGLTLVMRRPDLTVFSLILVVPMVLSSAVMLANRSAGVEGLAGVVERIRFSHLFMANWVILIFSLILLVSSATRPIAYFVAVSMYSSLILLQVVSPRPKWTDGLILLQISILSLNLIWGLTLKYPLYFGDTDLLVHLNLADAILKTGHVETYYLDYQNYPVYHIISAMGAEMTGMSLRTSLFLIMGLAWQVGILFAFLVFRSLSGNTRFALIGTLLFATSLQVVFYGSYSIARSLAFVFFLVWLYLIIDRAQKDNRFLALSLVVLGAMVMTHHINVLYVIPVVLVLYLCQLIVNRAREERLINPLFIYLFSISAVGYLVWVATRMANRTFHDVFSSLAAMEGGLKNSTAVTNGHGIATIFGTLYYSIALFLCLIGVRVVFANLKTDNRRVRAGIFAIAGLAVLVVYVPGFLDLTPLSGILLTDRLALMVSPFIAFLMAYGVEYVYRIGKSAGQALPLTAATMGICLVVYAATFLSVTGIGNAKDTNYFPQASAVDSPYFTRQELSSFTFLNGKGTASLPLFADYPTARNTYSLGNFDTLNILASVSEASGGYLLVREGELGRKGALSLFPVGQPFLNYTVRAPASQLNAQFAALANSPAGNRVYSDSSVEIYLMN